MKNIGFIRRCLLGLAVCFSWNATAQAQMSTLREQFNTPSEEAKPWCFWYWMYGAVSRDGITADLEAMKQAGLGGTYLMPIRGKKDAGRTLKEDQDKWPVGSARQLTPEWWKMITFAMQEADRLGLKLGMHICDGFALAGGPWITPAESMQKVVWADTVIVSEGRMQGQVELPQPPSYKGYYEDIRLFALPVKEAGADTAPYTLTVGSDTGTDAPQKGAVNIDEKGVVRSSLPCWIQLEYKEPFTCRNVEVVLSGNNYQAHRLRMMASDDGVNFRFVKQLQPARQGWQNTDCQTTHAVQPTTARFFRFYWTPVGSEPGSEDLDAAKWKPNLKIKELVLHRTPRIHEWEGKAGLVWRVALPTTAAEVAVSDCYAPNEIVDLTSQMKAGRLDNLTLPKGTWRLLRMGHTSTGHENETAGDGRGLECDKFSSRAVEKQFNHWFRQFFEQAGPELAGRVLKMMHVDSWECGSQNWSANFATEFSRRRGYDLLPWLPVLAGIPMESADRSEQVLRDVRTTIAELVPDVFYTVLAAKAKEYGCKFSAECVAPTMVSDGLLHYDKVDLPMGEFWLNSPTHDKPNDMMDAISGAHIYGKRIIQAEGFTQIRATWNEHPALLKPLLDRNFALGFNKLFFHVYVHNPWMDRKPGMTLDGIGLIFQRDQTWWKLGAPAFVDYISRCQTLLQYGVPVTDIAVFTGEEMPRRSVLPERLVPVLPGLFGTEKVRQEQQRLANEGQPLRNIDGVVHSANMADPDKWVNPLRGYQYDSFNRDALLRLAEVKDGRMVLPGGASYKVLVLPGRRPMSPIDTLSDAVRHKVEELRAGGVVIPEVPYRSEDFSNVGLQRDIEVPADVAWSHRRGAEADIYFVANQQDATRIFPARFRIAGRKPQVWYPLSGKIVEGVPAVERDGQTELTLTLKPYESLFVVFPVESGEVETEAAKEESLGRQPLSVAAWNITFEQLDRTIQRDTLFRWDRSADEQIRYYSGTALYRTHFSWKRKSKDRVILHLGEVYHVAAVRVNGVDCGTTWLAPHRVEITDALRKGTNTLEVEVVNTWANALLGKDEGKAPYPGIWTNAPFRMSTKECVPAGWAGPLEIERIKTK